MNPNVSNSTRDDWVPDEIFSDLEKDIEYTRSYSSNIEGQKNLYNRFLQVLNGESFSWNDRQISMFVKLLGRYISHEVEDARSNFIDELCNTIPENVLADLLRTNFELLRIEQIEELNIYPRFFSENEIIEIYSNFVCSDMLAEKDQMEVLEMLRNYSTKSYLQLAMELVCSRTTRKSKIQRNDILLHLLDKFFIKTSRGGTKTKYIHSLNAGDYMDEHGDLLMPYMIDFEDMLHLESNPEGMLLLSEILVTIVPHSTPDILLNLLFSDKMNVRYQRKLLSLMKRHFSYQNQKQYDYQMSGWEMDSNFGSVSKLFKLFLVTNSSTLKKSIEDCLIGLAYGPENLQTVIGFLESGVDIEILHLALRILSYSPHEYAIKPLLNLYYSGELNSVVEQKYVFRILSRLSGDEIADFYWHLLLNGAENFHSAIVNKLILTTPLTTLFNKLTDIIELSESNITSCIEHYTNSKTIFDSLTSLYSSLSSPDSVSIFMSEFRSNGRIKNTDTESYLQTDLIILQDLNRLYVELESLTTDYDKLKASSFCIDLIEKKVSLSNTILLEKVTTGYQNLMDFERSSAVQTLCDKNNFQPSSLSPLFDLIRAELRDSLEYYSHLRLLSDEWLCIDDQGIPNYMTVYNDWSNGSKQDGIIESSVREMLQRAEAKSDNSNNMVFEITHPDISEFILDIIDEFERMDDEDRSFFDFKLSNNYAFLPQIVRKHRILLRRVRKVIVNYWENNEDELVMQSGVENISSKLFYQSIKNSYLSFQTEMNALSLFRVHPAFWMEFETHRETGMKKVELIKKNLQFNSDSWVNPNADICSIADLLSILIRCNIDSGAQLKLGQFLINHRCIDLDLDLVSKFVLSLESSNGFHGYFNRLIPQLDSLNAIKIIKSFSKKPKTLNLFLNRFDEISKLFDEKPESFDVEYPELSKYFPDFRTKFSKKEFQEATTRTDAIIPALKGKILEKIKDNPKYPEYNNYEGKKRDILYPMVKEIRKYFTSEKVDIGVPQTKSKEWWDNPYLFTDEKVQSLIKELKAVNASRKADGTLRIGIQWKNRPR